MVTDLSGHAPRTVPARFEVIDDRFAGVGGDAHMEVLVLCRPLARGAGVRPGRPLRAVQRHPQRPGVALGRDHRRVGVFRQPAGYANGRTLDRPGRVVSCRARAPPSRPHRARRQRHRPGVAPQGRRLNSPNDVVVRADGTIWFTDPSYGIDSDYEGHLAASEVGGCHVYRIDPSGERRHGRRRLRAAQRPRLQRRRAPALRRRHPPPHTSGVFDVADDGSPGRRRRLRRV